MELVLTIDVVAEVSIALTTVYDGHMYIVYTTLHAVVNTDCCEG